MDSEEKNDLAQQSERTFLTVDVAILFGIITKWKTRADEGVECGSPGGG